MVRPDEFRIFYTKLMRLYPGRYQDDDDTLDAWYSQLNDIPAEYLDATLPALADDNSIDPRYAPNAIQIRRIAKRLSGALGFESLEVETQSGELDQLRGEFFRLHEQFYQDGTLIESDWKQLAAEFKHRNRINAAIHAEAVYQRLERMSE